MDRNEVIQRAIPFFTSKKYQVQTQTDYLVTFQSEEREVNWIIFLVFCCMGLLLAIIYYYIFCLKHQVTISMSGNTEVQITSSGNTEQAKKDAVEFVNLLSSSPVEGTICSQCGAPVIPGKNFCPNCGNKIG